MRNFETCITTKTGGKVINQNYWIILSTRTISENCKVLWRSETPVVIFAPLVNMMGIWGWRIISGIDKILYIDLFSQKGKLNRSEKFPNSKWFPRWRTQQKGSLQIDPSVTCEQPRTSILDTNQHLRAKHYRKWWPTKKSKEIRNKLVSNYWKALGPKENQATERIFVQVNFY